MYKAYDALDRCRCLDIIVAYGVGPLALCLIWGYWYRLSVVSRAGGYFGTPFKFWRGSAQGGLLSPMIFNVVVDAVLQILLSVVTAMEVVVEPVTEGFVQTTQWLAEYFYADYLILA